MSHGLDGVELVRVRLPLAAPWVTVMGIVDVRRVTLVRAVVDGVEGWGECVAQPEPTYSEEYEAGAWAVLTDHLVPRLLAAGAGRRAPTAAPVSPTWVERALAPVKGHRMAKAALHQAVLDAELRAAGVSLAEQLAAWSVAPGPPRASVPAGVAVGVTGDLDALLAEVARRGEEGYPRVKLKVHPGWDGAPVAAVRAMLGNTVGLQVDANGSYAGLHDGDALSRLKALDDHGLLLIEQPLGDEDLLGHARLARGLATPVCLDESLPSDDATATALAVGAARVVNVKPGRVGGLREAVRIHDRCVDAGVAAWVGGMLETGVGRAANLALAALGGFVLPGDLSAADRYWAADIVEPAATLDPATGTIAVPAGPGLGVSVAVPPAAVESRVWVPAGAS